MKVLIGGDSFGCGEWENRKITHDGLQYYLSNDNHNVLNVSEADCSNSTSIQNLINSLKFDPDIIIWFQTDPMRELRPYEDFIEKIQSYENLDTLNNELLDESYKKLNTIGKKIYCLGGCNKINTTIMSNYTNLIPLIEFIPEFLIPNYGKSKILYKLLNNSGWLTKSIIEKLAKEDLSTYKLYFWPDGGHPNRLGHLEIYNHIKKTILL